MGGWVGWWVRMLVCSCPWGKENSVWVCGCRSVGKVAGRGDVRRVTSRTRYCTGNDKEGELVETNVKKKERRSRCVCKERRKIKGMRRLCISWK